MAHITDRMSVVTIVGQLAPGYVEKQQQQPVIMQFYPRLRLLPDQFTFSQLARWQQLRLTSNGRGYCVKLHL